LFGLSGSITVVNNDPVNERASANAVAQVIDGAQPALSQARPRRPRPPTFVWQLQQVLAVAVLAAGCYFLISRFVLQSVTVVGMSMTPTLSNSQRYLLNRWVFHLRQPQRSEVVVLRDPSDNGYSVKRVIGVAGDTIALKQGEVYVNGQKLVEPYLLAGTPTYTSSFRDQVFHCPPGHYFLLGDNRKNSVDSRSYGPVPRANILGLVIR
jgi:signal peptidase I